MKENVWVMSNLGLNEKEVLLDTKLRSFPRAFRPGSDRFCVGCDRFKRHQRSTQGLGDPRGAEAVHRDVFCAAQAAASGVHPSFSLERHGKILGAEKGGSVRKVAENASLWLGSDVEVRRP